MRSTQASNLSAYVLEASNKMDSHIHTNDERNVQAQAEIFGNSRLDIPKMDDRTCGAAARAVDLLVNGREAGKASAAASISRRPERPGVRRMGHEACGHSGDPGMISKTRTVRSARFDLCQSWSPVFLHDVRHTSVSERPGGDLCLCQIDR